MRQGRATRDSDAGRKREPIVKKVHESAVADLGAAVQYKKEELYAGKGYQPPGPRPARAGPGGGRTIHRSGSQGKHGG
jgi:hypothetical protein